MSAQGPLVLGLGLRVWGQGLTIVDTQRNFFIHLFENLQLNGAKFECHSHPCVTKVATRRTDITNNVVV